MRRRDVLQVGAVGGALVLGVSLGGCADVQQRRMRQEAARTGTLVPNAWLRIGRDGTIVFVLDRDEMGQGTQTSHVMMVAEELEVAPETIVVERAPADRAYNNAAANLQITGGSNSVASSWKPLRQAAATARELLRAAAAELWDVPRDECVARDATIVHLPTGQSAPYRTLTELAARQRVRTPALKTPAQFRIIGKPVPRLDARPKVDGTAVYAIDVVVPGMACAAVLRPAQRGAALARTEHAVARAMPGVLDVLEAPFGVVVVADTYWRASRAVAALVPVTVWKPVKVPLDSAALATEYRRLARKEAKRVDAKGDVEDGLRRAAVRLEAEYEVPYLAHAALEPLSCTARVHDGRCDVWVGTQSEALAREVAARAAGVDPSHVAIHSHFIGGSFGRRLSQDFVGEAVWVAKRCGRPVKVIWSREDDTTNDAYRPKAHSLLRAGIDGRGKPTAWFHRLVTQSLAEHIAREYTVVIAPEKIPLFLRQLVGRAAQGLYADDLLTDSMSVQGAVGLAYDFPTKRVELAHAETGVPIGFWRSIGHSFNAFVVESFVDEVAHAARRDPFELRRALLARSKRDLTVLELAAARAGWGTALPPGRFRGIAQQASSGTACAHVAEVSVEGGVIRVHRVVVAIDCGLVVNPDLVAAQVEGCVVFGLSAALRQEITFDAGRVVQRNYDSFPVVRMHEHPRVEVHIVPSEASPTGVGEPPLPPLAPAVANAVFAATGTRLRAMPLQPALDRARRAQ